jgi:hypothetical protein
LSKTQNKSFAKIRTYGFLEKTQNHESFVETRVPR